MQKLITTFLILCFALSLKAQDQEQYTYIEDRTFNSFNEMMGYNFVPKKMEVPNEYDEDLSAGEYVFGVTRGNLYVVGGEIEGVYNVNFSDEQAYGYKLMFMNARNPSQQGHLKIIVNKNKNVDALIFKKGNKEKEIIFFLGQTPDETIVQDERYFTDKFEQKLEDADSIWNKVIQPFIVVENNFQDKLTVSDSLNISFIETVKITEKKKRVKKKRGKKKNKKADAEEQMMEEDKMAMKALGLETDDEEDNVKIKVDKSYKIVLKQLVKNEVEGNEEADEFEYVESVYPIKKVVEREDEFAKPGGNRYELEFTTTKGEPIFLYLTHKRTITSIKFPGKKYLMRGN